MSAYHPDGSLEPLEELLRNLDHLVEVAETLQADLAGQLMKLSVERVPWSTLHQSDQSEGLSTLGDPLEAPKEDWRAASAGFGGRERKRRHLEQGRRLRGRAHELRAELERLAGGGRSWRRDLHAWDAGLRHWVIDVRDWGERLPRRESPKADRPDHGEP